MDSLALTPGLLPLLTAGGQHRLLAQMLPLVNPTWYRVVSIKENASCFPANV